MSHREWDVKKKEQMNTHHEHTHYSTEEKKSELLIESLTSKQS